MVWSHTQGLDKELNSFIDAVLIVQTETTHIQSIRIGGVHSEYVTAEKTTRYKKLNSPKVKKNN